MYSIVLMAAVGAGPNSAAADVPAVVVVDPGVIGCTGCTGVYAGCTGYTAAYGCYGSCQGARLGLFHRHKASCHGGGYSCTGYTCFGSCTGCYGSGWGSCYGYAYPYAGCCGGCWGSCYGSYSYPNYSAPGYAYPANAAPAYVVPVAPAMKDDAKKSGASLKFRLPAAATLFVDGQPAAGQGTERAFFTPPLAAGQKYFYDVRAEFTVGGQKVVEEKRVVVEVGSDVTESFAKLFAATEGTGAVAGK